MARLALDGQRAPERRRAVEEGNWWIVLPDGNETRAKEYRKTMTTWAVQIPVPFTVDTLEGMHTGNAGDYLAIGPAGEMYPIKEDIFNTTYEPIGGTDATE